MLRFEASGAEGKQRLSSGRKQTNKRFMKNAHGFRNKSELKLDLQI
jgi:hypothetical protein